MSDVNDIVQNNYLICYETATRMSHSSVRREMEQTAWR